MSTRYIFRCGTPLFLPGFYAPASPTKGCGMPKGTAVPVLRPVDSAFGVVDITIEGIAPGLLMSNPRSMSSDGSQSRKRIPTPEEESASKCYWSLDNSSLILRAEHIMGSVLNAARPYRLEGRKSIIPYLAGAAEIVPDEILLGTKNYTIDIRPVRLKGPGGGTILRARPLIFPWAASFQFRYRLEEIPHKAVDGAVREIFTRAGRVVGVLEFRPQHKGKFGRFEVTRFQMLDFKSVVAR